MGDKLKGVSEPLEVSLLQMHNPVALCRDSDTEHPDGTQESAFQQLSQGILKQEEPSAPSRTHLEKRAPFVLFGH